MATIKKMAHTPLVGDVLLPFPHLLKEMLSAACREKMSVLHRASVWFYGRMNRWAPFKVECLNQHNLVRNDSNKTHGSFGKDVRRTSFSQVSCNSLFFGNVRIMYFWTFPSLSLIIRILHTAIRLIKLWRKQKNSGKKDCLATRPERVQPCHVVNPGFPEQDGDARKFENEKSPSEKAVQQIFDTKLLVFFYTTSIRYI